MQWKNRESDGMPPGVTIPYSKGSLQLQLRLSEEDQKKLHMVINVLQGYYGTTIGMLEKRQKFLCLLQNEDEPIASWEIRIRNQGSQCEYENFADELMSDQFNAGLTSKPRHVKLMGKDHRHRHIGQTRLQSGKLLKLLKALRRPLMRFSWWKLLKVPSRST